MIQDEIKSLSIEYLSKTEIGTCMQDLLNKYETVQENLYCLANADIKNKESLVAIRVGTVLTFAILKRFGQGKSPKDFSTNDWGDIANEVSEMAICVDEQKYTEFVFVMYSQFIKVSADMVSICASPERVKKIRSLADEIDEKTKALRSGKITEVKYVEDCMWIALEAMIKLIVASTTNKLTPSASKLIEATTAFSFEYGRYIMYRKEQEVLTSYLENQHVLDETIQKKYDEYISELQEQSDKFMKLIDKAFDPDIRISLQESIEVARFAGVSEENILKTAEERDDFFLA